MSDANKTDVVHVGLTNTNVAGEIVVTEGSRQLTPQEQRNVESLRARLMEEGEDPGKASVLENLSEPARTGEGLTPLNEAG